MLCLTRILRKRPRTLVEQRIIVFAIVAEAHNGNGEKALLEKGALRDSHGIGLDEVESRVLEGDLKWEEHTTTERDSVSDVTNLKLVRNVNVKCGKGRGNVEWLSDLEETARPPQTGPPSEGSNETGQKYSRECLRTRSRKIGIEYACSSSAFETGEGIALEVKVNSKGRKFDRISRNL